MKIIISRQELQAAKLFASTDDTRYVITGVNIEVAPGKLPVVVATDGRRVVAIETVAQQDQEFQSEHSILLRPDFVAPICALSKAFGGKLFPWICFDNNPGSSRVTVTLIGGSITLHVDAGALIEGQFPNWRLALPAKRQRREPITDIGLNAEFVGDFAKASKILGADSALIQMNLVGREQQVEVKLKSLPNFYGLVMQCKLDDSVEYQPEFVAIVDSLPKPESDSSEEKEAA
jgi:hypothetical protein